MIFTLLVLLPVIVTTVKSSLLNLDLALNETKSYTASINPNRPTIYIMAEGVRPIGTPYPSDLDQVPQTQVQQPCISNPFSRQTQSNAISNIARLNALIYHQLPHQDQSDSSSNTTIPLSSQYNAEYFNQINPAITNPVINRNSPSLLLNTSENIVDHVLESYLNSEVLTYNYKINIYLRNDALKKMIRCIAYNDRVGYKDNHEHFKQLCKHKFEYIKKNGIHFLPHYIIFFGATNFTDLFGLFI